MSVGGASGGGGAFFVAGDFPEIKTGDFPPECVFAFDDACASAGRAWLLWNDFQRLQ